MPPAFFIEIMLKNCIRALTWVNCRTRLSSCAPVLRWRQGQALRVLRNLDTAGRGRMIESAGSGGMPFLPHQVNRLLGKFFGGPGRWRIAKVYFAHSIRLKPMCRFFISASYAQACLRQSG